MLEVSDNLTPEKVGGRKLFNRIENRLRSGTTGRQS